MTVETTLTHGLQTSVLGTAYKAEADSNLAALDLNRITTVSATVAGLPAAGKAGRFAFVTNNGLIYYDNGTTWVSSGTLGTGGAAGSMLVSLAADQALSAVTTSQDILFNTINYQIGTMATATLNGSGGIVFPAGVTKVRYSARVTLAGMSTTTPTPFQIESSLNHLGTPSEGANQIFYTPGNAGGNASCMLSTSASIDVVATDFMDTVITVAAAPFPTSVLATTAVGAPRSWMFIEAI